MKRRLLALATTCLAATPAWLPRAALAAKKSAPAKQPAQPAQKDADDSSDDAAESTDHSETDGQTAAAQPADGKPRPPGDNVAVPSVNETHTVVKGDTLWDLSQHYLGNPWYWPKVWSYNPQIANPHWIYPGDQVKFSAQGGPSADEEAPAQVQPVGEEDETDDDDTAVVTSSKKIGYVAPTNSSFRRDGFVTDRELEESGQIIRSFSETEMLSNLDKVYCHFKNTNEAKAGERYFIYKTVREVVHPLSGTRYGYMTHIVGTATVASVDNGVVTAIIDGSYDEITRGDYLAPYSEKLSKAVAPKPASRKVEGVIIDAMQGESELGESQVVFIDRGKRDGIEEGNVVDVQRRTDGLVSPTVRPGQPGYEDSRLPAESVGKLMVVDAKEGASTCIVLKSSRELKAGDRFVTVTTEAGSTSVSLR